MTTDQKSLRRTREPGYGTTSVASVVRAALLWTLGVGVLAILVAWFVSGSSAAMGAGIGVALVCSFFFSSAVVLDVVTRLAPTASLLIALLTYTLNVVLIGLVFVSLNRSGAVRGADGSGGPIDAQWLGGSVIACTLVWMTSQIVFSMRARQLVYDLPPREEATAG